MIFSDFGVLVGLALLRLTEGAAVVRSRRPRSRIGND
jgi:hypothetical protein